MTERERLIELLKKAPYGANAITLSDKHKDSILGEIADYLLENGIIVPPVKASDMVFEIRLKSVSPSGRHTDHSVDTYKYLKHAVNTDGELFIKPKQYRKSDISRLGKTVFLTREEAKKALKEREQK